MNQEFINSFYDKLRKDRVDEDFIQSMDKLIKNEEFSSENLIDLIDGEFDE